MAEIGPWDRALPAPTTSILGRSEESTYVTNLLWDPEIRLVSLVGPGGVGKTRLAVEIAWELRRGMGFDDGVHLIDLAAVDDPDLVAGTVARALGIVDMGTGHDLDRVLDTIANLDLLLVLDNFEHLLPAVGLVATLLAAALHEGHGLRVHRCMRLDSRTRPSAHSKSCQRRGVGLQRHGGREASPTHQFVRARPAQTGA